MSFIYLSTKNKPITLDNFDKVDTIVLAPSLYWVQECTIPTRNQRKAKNIASHMMSHRPSDFTEIFLILEDKSKSLYKAYAYNKTLLDEFLQDMKIVNYKLYVADQLEFENVLQIKNLFLHKVQERTLELPFVDGKHKSVQYDESLLLNVKPIAKSAYNEKKSDTLFKVLAAMFLIYMFIDATYNWQILHNINAKLETLNTGSKNMSSYQREALIKKYKKLQKNLSKVKKDLLITLEQNHDLKKITYHHGKIKVEK